MTTALDFQSQYPRIRFMIFAIADWYRKWMSRKEAVDLENCTPEDIQRMAHDLGLTAGELRMLANTSDAPLLVTRLLAALKIDAAELARSDPAAFRDLSRVCALCTSKRLCETELASGQAARTYDGFCPNASTLKARQAGG